ncbi:MAG: hypothetical protein U0234_19105 [Sandaracinus sp.]
MSALPRALGGWERELAAFPDDLAAALLGVVGPIASLIGPWSTGDDDEGEPDGLGALSRRGRYERLLATEWLLADELPDEFLRRAASREHLFTAIARARPRCSRSVLALFDAGPSQLGAPRIAQIAVLLVIARRASAAGMAMRWGVLQRPGAPKAMLGPAAVEALLAARTAEEATDAHGAAWAEARTGADVWVVGGARAMRAAVGARGAVCLDDPLDPDRRSVHLTLVERGRERHVSLPLPSDALCARLLRDPFDAASASPHGSGAPTGRIALPIDGRRLVVADARRISSWGLPSSPRGTTGDARTIHFGEGERTVAIGHRGRRHHAVTVKDDGEGRSLLTVYRTPFSPDPNRPIALQDPDRLAARLDATDARAPVGTAYVNVLTERPEDPDLTLHIGRTLVSWRASERARPPRMWPDVIAVASRYDGMLLVRSAPEGRETRIDLLARNGSAQLKMSMQARSAHAQFSARDDGRATFVALASDDDPSTTTVLGWRASLLEGRATTLVIPDGGRALGAWGDPGSPALVLLDADERSVSVVSRQGARVAARSTTGRIVEIARAPRGPLVAWRTAEGWIEVASLDHEGVFLRLPPETAE